MKQRKVKRTPAHRLSWIHFTRETPQRYGVELSVLVPRGKTHADCKEIDRLYRKIASLVLRGLEITP